MAKHKCAGCGFLAYRGNNNEVKEDDREVHGRNANVLNADSFICLEQKRDLRNAFITESPQSNSMRMKAVLDGGCDFGRDWRPGFTAKEHEEMIDRENQRRSDKRWHLLDMVVIALATIVAGLVGYFFRH